MSTYSIPEAKVHKRDELMRRSPRALALYRSLVENDNDHAVKLQSRYELTDAVNTWFELTELEAYVFSIDPMLAHALLHAQVRYNDMVGLTHLAFDDFREEERLAFPECFHGDCVRSVDDMAAFMCLSCGLPYTEALAWACRSEIQTIRSNHYETDDFVSPRWLYGPFILD
jgi:hypothetical protein